MANFVKAIKEKSKMPSLPSMPSLPPPPKIKFSMDRMSMKETFTKPFKPTPAKAVANGGGLLSEADIPAGCEEFEIEGYNFFAETGYKQVIDPQTGDLSGRFIYDDGNTENLELRGRQIFLDKAIKQLHDQIEMLKKELTRLEEEKDSVESLLKQLPMKRKSDFAMYLLEPKSVQLLLPAEDELRELAYHCEAVAREQLPSGADYNVVQSGEFHRKPHLGGDPAIWSGWQFHLRSEAYHIGALIARRKYIPDTGALYQDFIFVITSYSDHDLPTDEFMNPLVRIAATIHPTKVVEYDKIDIQVKLDTLDASEGYIRWFQHKMKLSPQWHGQADEFCKSLACVVANVNAHAKKKLSGEPDDDGDAITAKDLTIPKEEEEETVDARQRKNSSSSSASHGAGHNHTEYGQLVDIDGGGGGGGSRSRGASVESKEAASNKKAEEKEGGGGAAAAAGGEGGESRDPWAVLAEMLDDQNNPLVYDFSLTQYFKETPDDVDYQHRAVAQLREQWKDRLSAYLAICSDGMLVSSMKLMHIVRAIESPGIDKGVKYVLERILDFFLLIRRQGQNYRGTVPVEKFKDQVTMSSCMMNEDVLCKLLKFGYVRRVLVADGGIVAYSRLLGALLQRSVTCRHLLGTVAREIGMVAASSEERHVLVEKPMLQLLAHTLALNDELVLTFLSGALLALAKEDRACCEMLAIMGAPRIIVPKLLSCNLHVRAVLVALLQACFQARQ